MNIILTIYILLSISITYSQDSLNKIFSPNKNFIYEVTYIKENGDTLSKEIITLRPKNEKWIQKSQNELEINYNPNYEALNDFIHPFEAERNRIKKNISKSKTKKSWANYTWISKQEITGYIENDSIIWFHPPRNNQYQYCALTPFPQIKFSQLKKNGNWNDEIIIMHGYPSNKEFVGRINNEYRIDSLINLKINNKEIKNCWVINAKATHNKLGPSNSTFVYDKNYFGFLKMDMTLYNGIKINFKLIEVKTY